MNSERKEGEFGKNFWVAMALSAVILLGYPYFLRWIGADKASVPAEETPAPAEPLEVEVEEAVSALTPPEGPFFERPSPPAVIPFENKLFSIEFSTLGASITRLDYKGENENNGKVKTLFYEGDSARPGIFGVRVVHEREDLTQEIFKLSRQDKEKNTVEFLWEKENEYRVIKQFHIGGNSPVISLSIIFENLSARERHVPLELDYAMTLTAVPEEKNVRYEAVVFTDKVESADLGKISKKGFLLAKASDWSGLIKNYFALIVKPDWKAISFEAHSNTGVLSSRVRMEPVSVAPNQRAEKYFLIYAGPQRYETLKGLDLGFEQILSKGFFGVFKLWLLIALKFCYGFTHNFGWAIILLTLAIKLAFTPLTHMSFQSMKKMQALQPKLKALQERHKKDPTKLNREMMDLYKRNRVNPLGGCLPMVVQIPIFIAFYQVLSNAIELRGAPFIWWMRDLSEPDQLITFPFSAPFIGNGFHLLPILMLVSMIWQQKLTPQAGATPEQTKMMAFMPLIFGFVFYHMPSGLVLYWFVNNVLSIIHQTFVKRMVVVLHHEDSE